MKTSFFLTAIVVILIIMNISQLILSKDKNATHTTANKIKPETIQITNMIADEKGYSHSKLTQDSIGVYISRVCSVNNNIVIRSQCSMFNIQCSVFISDNNGLL